MEILGGDYDFTQSNGHSIGFRLDIGGIFGL